MTPPDPRCGKMYAGAAQAHLLDAGNHALVAASGGPDSMALLHLLSSLTTANHSMVTAAHFDHHLRHDSHRDRILVEHFCADHGIAFRADEGDVRAWSETHGESLEAAARRLRYAFLERTADEVGADAIATAHTRDDNVETVLMRLLRGSGIRGLAGIPPRRGRVVRPFLAVTRHDIIAYCRDHAVPFVEDPSNRDTSFERNYIRHDVLPALRAGFPGADASLLEVAQQAGDMLASARTVTDPILAEHLVEESPGVWWLSTGPVAGLDAMTRYVLFGDALYYRVGCERELGRDHYRALSAIVDGGARSQSLPGLAVRREHGFVIFYHGVDPDDHPDTPARCLTLPGKISLGKSVVSARIVPVGNDIDRDWRARSSGVLESGGELTSAVAYFARERLAPPFTVRPPAPGDRMCPFGMGGHRKKLSDIFIDNKIPLRVRGRLLVVEDQRQIIWVAGVATSEAARIAGDTADVVELRVTIE